MLIAGPGKFVDIVVIEAFLAINAVVNAWKTAVRHQQLQWETEHFAVVGRG
ncbi:hypothetical protein D3C76_1305560 [compost metagenome]